MRILLVEDDPLAAQAITLALKSCHAIVDQCDLGQDAVNIAKRYDYDVILVDLMLSDIDGYEVIKKIRSEKIITPIIILSGLTRTQSKIKGLNVGADDFINKPFDKEELIARLQAIVRRSKGYSEPHIKIGNLVINLQNQEVSVNGNIINLTLKEYLILELMCLRKGIVVSKEAFLNNLYGGIDEPDLKIIDVFICKIRKKMLLNNCPNIITTIWGRGYMIKDNIKDNKASEVDSHKMLPVNDRSPECWAAG
ncbi:MAG TPA: response regulator transcription factor [Acetobacteraceae bacterium]|nr:response regulator transcription factor [Acetobacteraceae bacterium]